MAEGIKIVYIDYNFNDQRYPNRKEDGDGFFTHGFGGLYSRQFKKYHPEFEVECWKADSRINAIYEKTIEGILFRIFPAVSLGKSGLFSVSLLQHLIREKKEGRRIVFNVSSIRHLLFYSVALFLRKHPLVVQHHGEAPVKYKIKISSGLKYFFYRLQLPLEKKCLSHVDLFYILDDDIRKYLPSSLRVKKSTTGVDEQLFFPVEKNQAREKLNLDVNKKYLLHIGRLNYVKRADWLIDVYNEIKKERDDVQLIIGGAEKSDELYEYARQSGVLLYGMIPQKELYLFFSASEMYILPAYSSALPFLGIGMLPVQAMLCNVPVVGQSLRNVDQEIIDKVGILVNNKDELKEAVIKILNGEKTFTGLREIAIASYSWKNIAARTREDYLAMAKKYYN